MQVHDGARRRHVHEEPRGDHLEDQWLENRQAPPLQFGRGIEAVGELVEHTAGQEDDIHAADVHPVCRRSYRDHYLFGKFRPDTPVELNRNVRGVMPVERADLMPVLKAVEQAVGRGEAGDPMTGRAEMLAQVPQVHRRSRFDQLVVEAAELEVALDDVH